MTQHETFRIFLLIIIFILIPQITTCQKNETIRSLKSQVKYQSETIIGKLDYPSTIEKKTYNIQSFTPSIQFENTFYYADQNSIIKLDASNGKQEIIGGFDDSTTFISGNGGPVSNAIFIVVLHLSVIAEKDESSGKLFDVIYLVDLYSIRRIRMKTGIIDHITGILVVNTKSAPDVMSTKDMYFSSLNAMVVYPKVVNSLDEVTIVVLDSGIIRKIENDTVYRICGGSGGTFSDEEMPAINSTLFSPRSLALNSRNEIFISERGSNRFRKILQNGNIVTVYGKDFPVLPVSSSSCGYFLNEYNCPELITVYSTNVSDIIYFSDLSGLINRLTINNTDGSGIFEVLAGKKERGSEECRDGIIQAWDCYLTIFSNVVISQDGKLVYLPELRTIKVLNLETKMITPIFAKNNRILNMDGVKGVNFPLSQPTGLSFSYILNENINKLEKVLFISESNFGAMRYYDLTTKTVRTLSPGYVVLESSTYIDASLNYSLSSRPISFESGVVSDDTIEYYILNEGNGINGDSIIKVSQNLFSKERKITLLVGNALKPINSARDPYYMKASSVTYNQPEGILATDMGIFVADTYNNNIKLIGENNMVRVVVKNVKKPTGLEYFVNEFGVRYLIFSETGRHVIKKINLETYAISVVAGIIDQFGYNGNQNYATTALLNEPRGMTIVDDYSGYQGLLFADSLNHRIRFIHFNSTLNESSVFRISSISGMGVPSSEYGYYNTPHDISGCSLCQSYFVADTYNNRVKRLTFYKSENPTEAVVAGETQNGFSGDNGDPTMAKLFHPYSVTYIVDDQRSSQSKPFVIADTINSRLRSVGSKIIKTIVGGANDGQETEPTRGRSAKLKYPKAIDYRKGYIYIADTSNNKIRKYSMKDDLLTTISGGFGDDIVANQSSAIPLGMTRSKSGNIYLTDNLNNIVKKIDITTGIIKTIAGTGDYGFYGDNVPALSAILAYPTGIAVSPLNEDVYITDTNNHRIRKISAQDGTISTVCGTGNIGYSGDNGLALAADINFPTCIMLLPPKYEDFIFCDTNNGRYRRVYNYNGQRYIYTIAGNGTVDLVDIVANYRIESSFKTAMEVPISSPRGVAFVENTGKLFVSDALNNVVKQLVPFCENNYVLNPEKSLCVPKCFDLTSLDSKVCSGNGACLDSDTCSCSSKYNGNQCQYPICFGISSSNSAVCSNSNGTCIRPDTCSCSNGYIGSDCSVVTCFGKSGGDACNGNLCVAPNVCQCANSFGKECEHNSVLIGTIVGFSVFVLLLLGFSMLTMAIFFSKYRKQKKIIELDHSLDERLLSQTEGGDVEFLDIGKSQNSSFIIPVEELNMDKPIKRLGEGGIGSVFQTRWKNNIIAVKVFDMNNMNITERDFQMEYLILSKVRHPNIISWYGISSTPTKRFIAMECLEKSLDNLILQMQNQSVKLTLSQKLEIFNNVANGILYLHTLNPMILHRDLKPANILIDRFGVCKLCDFGLSKMVSNYKVNVTQQIGTCYYLSPEMISSKSEILGEDARAIDVYSFSIIIWQVLFECTDPYMSRNSRVLQKLGLEEPLNLESSYQLHKAICENNLRPIIPFTDLRECKEWCTKYDNPDDYEKIFELTELIRQSWSPIPSTRPNIQEVVERLQNL